MNRVARGVRTVVGIVLLCLLASTVTAGAADPSVRSGVADPDLARGIDGGDEHEDDVARPAGSIRPVAADQPPTRRSAPDGAAGAGTSAHGREGDGGKDQRESGAPDRGPATAGKSQNAQEKQQNDGKKPPAKGKAEQAQSSGNGKGGGKPSNASRRVGEEAWAAFDWTLGGRLAGSNHAVSVAVSVDGRIAHRATFGERVAGKPAKPSNRFRIASISKMFASTAALRLVERGELSLDKPITGRVADALGVAPVDPRAGRITVRQLLAHTSGFGGHDNEFFGGGADSCSSAAEAGFRRPLRSQPGTSYNYSNMNYCLLGLVLEDATGKPYEQVLNHEVLEPLGIDTMRVAGTFDVRLGDVRHPSSAGRNYMETLGAAGSWLATPSDVVALMDSLDPATPGWHPLSNELVAEMKAPGSATQPGRSALRRPGPPSAQWYGLGLMVFEDGSYGHTGTLERTHAMTVARPDGVTWAVTVSGENPSNSSDLRTIMDESLAAAGLG